MTNTKTVSERSEFTTKNISQWKGSMATAQSVAQQIFQRYGAEYASLYNPNENCFTFNGWKARGYHVKRGERALRSITILPVEIKDKTTGEARIVKTPRNVNLFFINQVQRNDTNKNGSVK